MSSSQDDAVGILASGGYIPSGRVRLEVMGELGRSGRNVGHRSVASYDEDTTTMGVEAARVALAGLPPSVAVDRLYFSTAVPAYLDKTNALIAHQALSLSRRSMAVDMVGSARSGIGALRAACADRHGNTLVLMSDIRTGQPGSAEESAGGDGAAALLVGGAQPGMAILATYLSSGSSSVEMLTRWRTPGESYSRVWEDRFGVDELRDAALEALDEAVAVAGLDRSDLDRVLVCGLHHRAVSQTRHELSKHSVVAEDDVSSGVGNTGTAHPGLALALALETAQPDENIALITVGDGCDAMLFRTTDAVLGGTARSPLGDQLRHSGRTVDYLTFLAWRGFLKREPLRRPDPDPPAAPPSLRTSAWKFGLIGSRCLRCESAYLPPYRVCVNCDAVDEMADESFSGSLGTVAALTVDHLAYSPHPPLVGVVVDFDGGGRLRTELTDVGDGDASVGMRVEMTFRRPFSSHGVHNYGWKARAVRGSSSGGTGVRH